MKPAAPGLWRSPDAELRLASLEARWGSFDAFLCGVRMASVVDPQLVAVVYEPPEEVERKVAVAKRAGAELLDFIRKVSK